MAKMYIISGPLYLQSDSLQEIIITRAGTNTPSDEYDTYREYRVANTNMYSRIQ